MYWIFAKSVRDTILLMRLIGSEVRSHVELMDFLPFYNQLSVNKFQPYLNILRKIQLQKFAKMNDRSVHFVPHEKTSQLKHCQKRNLRQNVRMS